jgi:putative ABC transport system permease protein
MTWWTRLVRRRRVETELDAELRDHMARLESDLAAGGLDEAEAKRRARLSFGGVEQVKELCRDARGTRWAEQLAQDVRYAFRILARSPGFTAVAVLSLALGIGANAAIFSLVDRLLLRGLPVREADRLVLLEGGSWTNPVWEQIRDRQDDLFEGAVAWSHDQFDMARAGQAETVEGLWVSGGFFDVLGVPAMLGRTFLPEDDRRGGGPHGPVAVISYRFWQQRYGGAADAIGRPLTLNRVPFTIVGVTPPEFSGPVIGLTFDVAVPIAAEPLIRGDESWLDARSTWWLEIMARLRPGQSVEEANRALAAVQPQIRAATLPDWPPDHLKHYLGDRFNLAAAAGGPANFRDRYRDPLLIVMVAVGLVLLIACANIANLQLARASGRAHEFSVRAALGASRLRLARQLLTESLILSFAGAAAGLVVARWASELLVRQLSTYRDRFFLDLSPDWRVLTFTAAIATGTALLFGMVPALRAGRTRPIDAIAEHGRSVAGMERRGLSGAFIVMQVAFSLILIVGAGLFVRTFSTLATLDLGFDRDPILHVVMDAQRTRTPDAERLALFERVRTAVAALPGVNGAALTGVTPLRGEAWSQEVDVAGEVQRQGRDRIAWFNAVTPGAFTTYGTRLLAGRPFDDRDRDGAPPVAIVNEAFLRRFITKGEAVGRVVERLPFGDQTPPPLQIVGVVEDTAYRSIREGTLPTVYLPLAQQTAPGSPGLTLVVRSAEGIRPSALTRSIANAIAGVDGDLSMTFLPLTEQIAADLARERMLAFLSGFFGGLALLLAAVGLYGVTAYAVSRRRTEIGIRMALGAHAGAVVRMVLGRAAALVAAGLAIGAAVSIWASQLVSSLLYGVEARDAATLVFALIVLAVVGTLAAWLPARRAARIDPANVLREG